MGLKILHTADWHIGKEERTEDIFKQIEKLITIAKDYDFVIVAGDLFDDEESISVYGRRLKETIRKTQTPFLAILGNHEYEGIDKIEELFSSPPLTIFTEPKILNIKGIKILFYPFKKGENSKDVLSFVNKKDIDLAVLHGSIMSDEELTSALKNYLYFPLYKKDIVEFPFKYVALGHYHNYKEYSIGNTTLCYSGTIEPLTFDNEGERYVNIIQVEDSKIIQKPLNIGSVSKFKTIEWSWDEEDKMDEIINYKQKYDFLRVIITGFTENTLKLNAAAERLRQMNIKVELKVESLDEILSVPIGKIFYEKIEQYIEKEPQKKDLYKRAFIEGCKIISKC